MTTPLRLGIAGLGTVGTGVVRIVQRHADRLAARTGRRVEITAVSARSRDKDRGVRLKDYAWEDDPVALATRDDVDDYEAALKAADVEYTFYRYDGAGHAFQNFPTPERYREAQSEDAWEKTLAFFNRHLITD